MHLTTKSVVSKVLSDKTFNICVDLGCGNGSAGDVLKPHCVTLIGVDHNLPRLSVAKEFGGYDQVVYSDVRSYKIPYNADAVSMFDFIEHIPRIDCIKLLQSLRNVPFVVLTTPTKFFQIARDGHLPDSVWSKQELESYGFKVTEYSEGMYDLLYGSKLLAVK